MNLAAAPGERKLQIGLFTGLMLLFLVVWKGEGGYLDLYQYLDNTENMWMKGNLSAPPEPLSVNGYYIHPLGISYLSGPFILTGAVLQKMSGGAIKRRQVAALAIPVFCALACVLLYNIGRELQFTPAVSLWGALMLGLATPFLGFTRLYFGEGGIAVSVLFGLWAFLRAQRAGGRAALGWALLAGAGLAGTTACHFNNTFVSFFLWIAMAAAFILDGERDKGTRVKLLAALTVIPVFAGAGLMYMNWSRWGTPFSTGYDFYMNRISPHPISFLNVADNFPFLLRWVWRVPWVVPAFYFFFKLLPKKRMLALGLILSVAAHILFLQTFIGYSIFFVRYLETAVVLLSVGLMLIGNAMWQRWETRGLVYFGLALLLFNMVYFIRYDSYLPAFLLTPDGNGVTCYVWYMEPPTVVSRRSLMGTYQWTLFTLQLVSGLALLALTIRAAWRLSAVKAEPAPQNA